MVALRAVSRFVPLSNRLTFPRPPQRALATIKPQPFLFSPLDTFAERHIGPDDHETSVMLAKLGYASMDAFIDKTVPHRIRVPPESLNNDAIPVLSESQLHARAQALGEQNKRFKNYIGMGYHSAVVPPVILRNVCSSSTSVITLS
jgi:glycine dehydrogenase